MRRKCSILFLVILLLAHVSLCAIAEEAVSTELPKLTATERGGTWILRVPQALLESVELHKPDRPASQYSLTGLCARGLTDAVEQRLAYPSDGSLFMNLRVLDGDCYIVTRPTQPYSAEFPFLWTVEQREIQFFEADTTVSGVSEALSSVPEMDSSGYTQVYSDRFAQGDIAVYRAMDVNIAVIHWRGEEELGLIAMAQIGGTDAQKLPVTGYASGKQFTYCCIITDAELGALVAGGEPVTFSEPEIDGEPEVAAFEPLPDLSDDSLD